jgi:hypothetical protein
VHGPQHPETLVLMGGLAGAYLEQGKNVQAAALHRQTLDIQKRVLGAEHAETLKSMANLAVAFERVSDFGSAELLLREALAIYEKKSPDDWHVFHVRSLLGGVLVAQKKFELAEPLLVSGYEGMKQREAKIHVSEKPRLGEARERLVRLYTDWGRPQKAAAWREEFERQTRGAVPKAEGRVNP